MLAHILRLFLPAILPSWRFFDVIAPSPRIQFSLLNTATDTSRNWQEFRPRPKRLSFMKMLSSMAWNPEWNEALFMLSCAERLIDQPTAHSENEIMNRIMDKLTSTSPYLTRKSTHLQFRLLLIQRLPSTELQQKIIFHSRIQPLPARELK